MTNVSNEDILETLQTLMQMTGDGFARLETRMDRLEGRVDRVEITLQEHTTILNGHTVILNEHSSRLSRLEETTDKIYNEQMAQRSDIIEIFARIHELEKKAELDAAERKEAQEKLQTVVNWAQLAAKQLDIPLKLG